LEDEAPPVGAALVFAPVFLAGAGFTGSFPFDDEVAAFGLGSTGFGFELAGAGAGVGLESLDALVVPFLAA